MSGFYLGGEEMLPSDVIEKYGWVQDTGGDVNVGFCFVGAVERAADLSDNLNLFEAFCAAAEEIVAGDDVIQWNDTRGRTKQEVLKLMRRIAVKLGLWVAPEEAVEVTAERKAVLA